MNGRAADARWEKKLNIDTGAARHEKDDQNHSRYEIMKVITSPDFWQANGKASLHKQSVSRGLC